MIIFKKQDLHSLFESMRDRMISNVSEKRNLSVRRCSECGLLFQTLKHYPKKLCTLCRYENSEEYRKGCREKAERFGEIFDEKLLYANKLKIHQTLQFRKDRVNEAFKVKSTNEPTCSRIL